MKSMYNSLDISTEHLKRNPINIPDRMAPLYLFLF